MYGSDIGIQDTLSLNGIRFYRPKDKEILPLTHDGSMMVKKIFENNNYTTITDRKFPRCLFGLRSYFAHRHPDKVSLYDNGRGNLIDPIEGIIADDKPGVKKRMKHHYIEKDCVNFTDTSVEVFHSWKVCANTSDLSKRAYKVNYTIVDPNMIVGETWTIVGHFGTVKEAENYKKYLSSSTVKMLLKESVGGKAKTWGFFVPDLENYSDDNLDIDFNNPLDDQLKELFA